jgi:hypothetical protein
MDARDVLLEAGHINSQIKHISDNREVDQQYAHMKPAHAVCELKNFEGDVHRA